MNIIIEYSNDTKIQSLAANLDNLDHHVNFWIPSKKPFFDMVYEIKPDLVFLAPSTFKEDYKNTNIKFILLTQDLIPEYCYDQLQYTKGEKRKEMECEVLYISYEQVTPDFQQFLFDISNNFKLKCIGPIPLPMVEYVGMVTLEELNNFIMSATHVLCYNNALMVEVIKNGGCALATKPNDLDIPVVKSIEDIKNIDMTQEIKYNYTYEHLIKDLFKENNIE